MFSLRRILAWTIAAVFCTALAPAPLIRTCPAQPRACAEGPATGLWKLPVTLLGHGVVLGHLTDSATGQSTLRLRAELRDEPTSCMSCIEGKIRGFIDDTSGVSTRLFVKGTYTGSALRGTGEFDLRVFEHSGGPAIGEIHGTFGDAPGDGLPGRFSGDWRFCR